MFTSPTTFRTLSPSAALKRTTAKASYPTQALCTSRQMRRLGLRSYFIEYPRHPNQCDMNMYGQAPADAFESRDFNGLPGCIIRGGSKPIVVLGHMDPTAIAATLAATEETEWVYDLGYQIQVHAPVTDTRQTYISISTSNQGKMLTEQDLIKVAESLRLVRS